MTGGRGRRALRTIVIGALALAACTADGNDAGSGAAPPDDEPQIEPNGETVRVRSLDNSFRTEVTEIVAGTEILWTNDGRNEHDVLPVDDTEQWGVTREAFEPGDEYRHVFLEPGTYPYYCSLHGTKEVGMVGTIIVTAPEPSEG